MGVYYVLVKVIFRSGFKDFEVFLFTSVVVWKFFAAGVGKAIIITVTKERQMRHVRFPNVVFPIAAVFTEGVRFVVALIVLVCAAVGFGIVPEPTLPLILIVAAVQAVLTLGFAVFLSAVNIFFRDVQHITAYVFQAWFFLSPALYPISAVPSDYRQLYELNPFATLLPAYHGILLEGRLPDFTALGAVGLAAMVFLGAGYAFFVRVEPAFAKVS
jgi:ABC-2 type transport system permease protein